MVAPKRHREQETPYKASKLEWLGRTRWLVLVLSTYGCLSFFPRSLTSYREGTTIKGAKSSLRNSYPKEALGDPKKREKDGPDVPQMAILQKPFPHQNERRNKSRLVLHVGPPKTATTSIQTDLTAFEESLKSDGYEYAGRFYRSFTNLQGNASTRREDSRLQKSATSVFKACKELPRTNCFRDFVVELDKYEAGQKVIISDESLSSWREEDVMALREAIGNEWDVLVVVGYRRLYEWLPSTKFQRERIDRWSAVKSNWPGPGLKGLPLDPLFPDYLEKWRIHHVYTDVLVDMFQKAFPVSVLNLYDEATVRTTLLCNIIHDAPNTCTKSKQLDQDQGETRVNQINDAPSSYYDSLATAAAHRGLLDVNTVERRYVACDIKKHQVEVLKQGFMDFPLKCPTERELSKFLNDSLLFEAKLIPSSSEASVAEHKERFRSHSESKAFCWIDTDAALASEEWKSYFSRYASSDYAARLKYGWRCEE
jgi:hypothetical protein